MVTTYYNILNTLLVEIADEEGRSVDQLRRMYEPYRVHEPQGTPDIHCELTDDDPRPDEVLGYPLDHYARDGDRFVVRQGPNFVKMDTDWRQFSMSRSPGWEPFKTVYLIELELRRRLLDEERTLIHASGIQFEGQTILFPAWRSAGKTNTLLSLLLAGGDYLSDDRLWVREDGAVQGYPLPVNVGTEQIESFTEIEDGDKEPKEQIKDSLDSYLDPTRSFIDKGLLYLTEQFLGSERSFSDLDTLVPDATYVNQATVDAVVLLRAAPQQTVVSVDRIPPANLAKALRAIHHYEWNGQIEEFAMALDSLFPQANMTERFERIRSEEQTIQENFLQSVPTYMARVPRTKNWERDGIRSQIVDAFSDLTRDTEPKQRDVTAR